MAPYQDRARDGFDFYGPQYARFDGALAAEVRREVYGDDMGQQGWRTVAEQAEIAAFLGVGSGHHILDVACGAGGPSLALVERTGCRLTGLDSEKAAMTYATAQALARGLGNRVHFSAVDCGRRLPLADAELDAVLCVDAICHLPDRLATLSEWARVVKDRGRVLFTDPAVLTGELTRGDLEVRASAGFFLVVPSGLNERAIEAAGLTLLRCEDRTAAVAEIATRWHAARLSRAAALRSEEGVDWFEKRQRFLAMTAELAGSRRLSRFLYLAEKRGPTS